MKTIKDLFELYKATNPKQDEHMLDPQHSVQKHPDYSGNGDDVFKASKIKQTSRKKGPDAKHGYESGEDKIVYDSHNKKPAFQTEEFDLDESIKVGTYTTKDGSVLTLHKAEHDPKHHMLVRKKDGHVVAGYAGTSQEVHKKLTDEGGLSGSLHEETLDERNADNKFKKDLHIVKKGAEFAKKGINFARYDKNRLADASGHDHGIEYGDGDDASEIHASRKSTVRLYKHLGRKAMKEDTDLDEARQMTPALKAAQDNLRKINNGDYKREAAQHTRIKKAESSWKQAVKDDEKYHKGQIKHHQDRFKHHAEHAKEAENLMHDLHSGNLGIPKENKDHFRGAEDEIDAMHNAHLEKMVHHKDKMHYHNSFLSKPLKLKEDVEQIDEISDATKERYLDKGDKWLAKDNTGQTAGSKSEKRAKMLNKTEAGLLQKGKKPSSLFSGSLKKEAIDKFYDSFIADKVEIVDLEESFKQNISALSEKTQATLIDLFNSLNEENQEQMVEISESNEGLNNLLDFALTGGK